MHCCCAAVLLWADMSAGFRKPNLTYEPCLNVGVDSWENGRMSGCYGIHVMLYACTTPVSHAMRVTFTEHPMFNTSLWALQALRIIFY